MRKAAGVVSALGIRPQGDGYNAASLAFPDGSRIVGLRGSGRDGAGFPAVSMLPIDEASRVHEAMYQALRPMLAVGGEICG